MSTRCQIGFHESLRQAPEAIIYQHSDGHPTGKHGMVGQLLEVCNSLMKARGYYDAEYLAARTLVKLAMQYDKDTGEQVGNGVLGYGISSTLHGDTRFYYALTEEGITVYDARTLTTDDLDNLGNKAEMMFFTAWEKGEERRELEKEISATDAALKSMKLRLESLKRRGSL